MISLLLTLFISLFSICPSVDRLEDQYENNIIESSYVVEKKAFTNQQYLYLSCYDLINPSNILATLDQLRSMPSLPTANGTIDGETFYQNGGTLVFNSSAFLSGITPYLLDYNTQSLNTYGMTVNSMSYVLQRDSVNNNIDFKIDFNCTRSNTTRNFYYDLYQVNQTFSGQVQSTWCCSAVQYRNGSYYSTIDAFVWLFNQNITYDYWRMGDDDYNSGYINGYSIGFEDGRMDTQATYDEQVYEEGRQAGYAEGIQYATDTGSTASTIFNGIFDVGLLPVNVFLTIFNFEVFGINIAGIVSALLTLSVVIIIVRFLLGGKNDDK